MSRSIPRCLLIALVAAPLALGACKQSETEAPAPTPPPAAPAATAPAEAPAAEPFRVSGLEVGTALGADKRVINPSATVSASEPTIYASVATDGATERVTLTARWTYEDGQVVAETNQEIAPDGAAVSEFHIEQAEPWPTGQYQVEILADGRSLGTSKFEVQ